MFTHLHVHSQYSVLDGMSKVPDLVEKCLRTGMMSMALTDHGNMYGIKELLDYCKGVNGKRKDAGLEPFKPIVGVEAYCARRSRLLKTDQKVVNGEGREYLVDRSGWHLILLAKDMVGYHSLCKLVSAGFMDDAYYYSPRIDKELLEQYHEGLICSSACLGGELPQKIMTAQAIAAEKNTAPDYSEVEEAIEWFKGIFGEDYYIEIQRHQTDKPEGDQMVYQRQLQVNPVLIDLAHKHGVKIIATNDAHFVEEEHAEAHDRLICLSTNHYVDDANRMHYTKQEWLKSPEEMAAIFGDIPEALENTQEIVDKVTVFDIDHGPIMPLFPIPEDFGTEDDWRKKYTPEQLYQEFTTDENGLNPLSAEEGEKKIKKLGGYDRLYRIKFEADYLAKLTWDGAMHRYPELKDEIDKIGDAGLYQIGWDSSVLSEHCKVIVDRIKFELHVMKTMGFPGYFLIVMDFIRGAREELGVSVGPGRGSAAGSVVAYCLHITDLDPLTYDLLFERFLNPDRISLPDIDTDFDDAGRGKVLDWVSEKYGHTHVAHIITYGTMATKSALADVGRVQRVPLPVVNDIKKLVPDAFPENLKDEKGKSPKINLKNCYKYVDELRQMLNGTDENIKSMLNYAQQLEDTIRQIGIHACGVIIGADDLTKFAPLSSVEDKETNKRVLVTQYDGHVIESVGLIKMDFLGLKTLTIIKECLAQIRRAKGDEVDIDHIPLDDELTYKLFSEGRTVAVFQFESPGMQKYLRELQPNVITDLIAMNALYRPGPIAYIPNFIRRKKGEEPITYDLPEMEPYLKDTYGVTVYQEQVMLLSRALAGFTRGESDNLRKAMGKKKIDIVEKMEKQFIEGGKANGHPEDVLKKIYTDWRAFASYAFNKSHAACYAWVAYQTGYLKAHYPAEFMAANLTVAKDDIKEVTKFMDECKSLHIPVLSPDVNESDMNFTVNSEGAIRFGLGGVKGVGEAAVQAIISEREKNGKYKDIFNFLERVDLRACNKKTIENLAYAGAFDCFTDVYREQLVRAVNSKGENVLDTLVRYGSLYQQDQQERRVSLFGDMFDSAIEIQHPELPMCPHMSTIEKLNIEKSLIGIFLSAHPLDDYEFEIRNMANVTANQLRWFRSHEKPDERNRRQIIIRDWEKVILSSDDESGDSADAEEPVEPVDEATLMMEFVQQYKNQPLHVAGIITKVENRISSKDNKPWGIYTIEDYSGSYEFALFGDNYQQLAPMLQENLYVYLTGVLQQWGGNTFQRDGKTFRRPPKPDEEASWEIRITGVDMLADVQKKMAQSLTIELPIDTVTSEMTKELVDMCHANPGTLQLRIVIFDEDHRHVNSFVSATEHLHVGKEFYHWLAELPQMGGGFYVK